MPVARVYLPDDHDAEGLALVARAGPAGVSALVPDLVRAVRQVDPRLVPVQAGSLDQLAARTIEQRVAFRLITGTIGVGSLLMVGAGVWGLTHSSLRRRWREFGIRQALGARRADVARRALADAWVVGLVGGSVGVLGAWLFGRVLESWLFGVDQYDPVSHASAVGFVLLAVFTGAILPARQAGRIDPAELLRSE
jgi:ABC-type antimicrobial peptide transport system permease subunit